jgi:hypothetical protein
MDTIPAIIFGIIFIVYGIFVFNGKLLWFLTTYKLRFKDEPDKNCKKKSYRIYGLIFIITGILILIVGSIFFLKGIISTKTNYLH